VILLLALLMLIGGGGVGNPKTASSIFDALEASGMLRDVAAPTAFVGLALLIIGLLVGVVAGRGHDP
jgi:hypothetical protein